MGTESQLPPFWGTPDRVQAGTQHFVGLTCSTGLHTGFMSVFCGIALPQHSLVPNSSTDYLSKKMRLGVPLFSKKVRWTFHLLLDVGHWDVDGTPYMRRLLQGWFW